MLGRSRIGLIAVLVAALVALGASPAYAGKKTGTIPVGGSVTLLNASGFVKVEFLCRASAPTLGITAQTPLNFWVEEALSDLHAGHLDPSDGRATYGGGNQPNPKHFEWGVQAGSKAALGQVYGAGDSNNCTYISQVS